MEYNLNYHIVPGLLGDRLSHLFAACGLEQLYLRKFYVSMPSPIVQGITLVIASLICLSSSHYQTTPDRLQTAVELTCKQ
jgi:hypothetical protein